MDAAWTVRPMVAADLPALAGLLNGWFGGYLDHVDYTPEVLGFLDRVLGWTSGPSVVAEGPRGLVGVLVGGYRDVMFEGARLCAVNLGLLAVSPLLRRQGLARALDEAFGVRGAAAGADLISLLTQEVYRSHRFYPASGYTLLERFQPLGAAIGEVERLPGLMEVEPAVFRRLAPRRPPRRGVITEVDVPPPPTDVPSTPVRCFVGGPAGVAIMVWPVRLRAEGAWRDIRAAQILDAYGHGTALQATVAGALAWARGQGCEGVMQMPGAGAVAEGLSAHGGAWTLRYARGLSEAGRAAVAAARGYDEVAPAP